MAMRSGSYKDNVTPKEIRKPMRGERVSFAEDAWRTAERLKRAGIDPYEIKARAHDAVRTRSTRTASERRPMVSGFGPGRRLGGGHWRWTESKGWTKVSG